VSACAATATVAGLIVAPAASSALTDGPPTQPGAVTTSNVTMNSVDLAWGASQDTIGVEGYEIFRSAGGPSTLIATTDGGITHYTARHLYANTAYSFGVVAIDTQGRTSSPATATLTTATNSNATPPLPPADASVSAKPFSDTRIDVVWAGSPSTDVSGYLVLRDGTQVGRIDLPGGLHYSDNNPGAGIHTYTIEAVDSAGNVSAATTPKPPATASTLPPGTVRIARGPYLSNVTATSAIVSWWTNIPSSGVVDYGLQSTSEHTVTDPAGSVQHHAVTISGLSAGRAYTYAVGDGTVMSTAATLRTAAAPGTPFSFAAIGDFGGASPGESQNATNIAGAGTSFVQTLGDNIYPSAGAPDPDFSTVYSDYDARFFAQKMFGQVVRNQAFFPADGNQEYYSEGKFWQTFPMPAAPGATWYSYDWGDAHILVLDTEVDFAPGSPQYDFAQADLAAHQNAAWRIVAEQRPAYSSTSAHSSSKPVLQYLVPLFEQNKVNLVLSGNSHNYERTFPLKGGVPATGGVTYVVSGGGGNGHNPFTTSPAPAWSAFRDDTHYEYAKVSVSPTTLKVEAINAATNTVLDSTTMTKPLTPTTLTPAAATVTISYGQRLTLSAHIAPSAATGTVQFRTGSGSALCTATVSAGVATCSTSTKLTPGTWTVDASFSSTALYAASSTHFSVVVKKAATTVKPKAAKVVITYGHRLTVTATVAPAAATGTVLFRTGSGLKLCTATATAGVATCSVTSWALNARTWTVYGFYSGSKLYAASSTHFTVVVNKAGSALTVKTAKSVRRGSMLTVTAVGLPWHATGLVRVIRSGHTFCSAAVSKGSAHCSFHAWMPVGTDTLVVRYLGNQNYFATSRKVQVRVT
jgi:hypothetical protein